MTASVETFEFQAEANQMLQLVIHSVYSNKDVFLRELISNASDALDKLRLETFRDKDLSADTSDLHIYVESDPATRTLVVRDNGIGMSAEEVVSLIGTIAKSGTADFLDSLSQAADSQTKAELIGQFGIGFYSTFMVADSVTLVTRKAGEGTGTRWQSVGDSSYTIETVEDAPVGSTVTLQLKAVDGEDGLPDYADAATIRELITRYSDFIAWPIKMPMVGPTTSGSPDLDASEGTEGAEEQTGSDQAGVAASASPAQAALETVNSRTALWSRSKDEITEQEYRDFYRYVTGDWNNPLETIHLKAEGALDYQALLFIPTLAPFSMFQRDAGSSLQLFINRVLVMSDCDLLLPPYLRFVSGVVDANDLSLNVSRELLQRDRHIAVMRRRLTKSVLTSVKSMMDSDSERYAICWAQYGRALKEGLVSDYDNRSALLQLSSFASTHDENELTTLRNYVQRMPAGQHHIYYAIGESRAMLQNSPHMEVFVAKGFEVLLLTDPIDEMWVHSVTEFADVPLRSINQASLSVSDGEEVQDPGAGGDSSGESGSPETPSAPRAEFDNLLAWLGETLADDVTEVRLSSRLTTSPSCLVSGEYDPTPSQEKNYRAAGHEMPRIRRILEINPDHPLVTELQAAHALGVAPKADDPILLTDLAHLLIGMTQLAEGGEVADPARFVNTLAIYLSQTVNHRA